MAEGTGLLVRFDEPRRSDLIRQTVEGTYEPFSDALSIHDWDVRNAQVALLSFSETTIDYVAIARRGKQVVTSKSRVEFSSMLALDGVAVAALERRLQGNIRQHFVRVSRGFGGTVPETTWDRLIEAVKAERPSLAAEIDRLKSLARYSGVTLQGKPAELFTQEREALGISLDIFAGGSQLRDRVLSEWAPRQEAVKAESPDGSFATLTISGDKNVPSNFLSGISSRYIQEESGIQHDLFNWDGATAVHEVGTSVFIRGSRRLEVVYANRNDLEHTLGVDLIYYNEPFRMCVLVQYKLMRDEGSGHIYRPDPQLADELSRMDMFYERHKCSAAIQCHEDFRLNDDGFMVKLMPNRGLRPASGELIKGMYIPREYMHFLLGPGGPKGQQGGTVITFDNAPRYLTNSQFSVSVNSGWLGTRGVQTQTVREMIRAYYETGRAVVVARETR
jgi:hypothetical protein